MPLAACVPPSSFFSPSLVDSPCDASELELLLMPRKPRPRAPPSAGASSSASVDFDFATLSRADSLAALSALAFSFFSFSAASFSALAFSFFSFSAASFSAFSFFFFSAASRFTCSTFLRSASSNMVTSTPAGTASQPTFNFFKSAWEYACSTSVRSLLSGSSLGTGLSSSAQDSSSESLAKESVSALFPDTEVALDEAALLARCFPMLEPTLSFFSSPIMARSLDWRSTRSSMPSASGVVVAAAAASVAFLVPSPARPGMTPGIGTGASSTTTPVMGSVKGVQPCFFSSCLPTLSSGRGSFVDVPVANAALLPTGASKSRSVPALTASATRLASSASSSFALRLFSSSRCVSPSLTGQSPSFLTAEDPPGVPPRSSPRSSSTSNPRPPSAPERSIAGVSPGMGEESAPLRAAVASAWNCGAARSIPIRSN